MRLILVYYTLLVCSCVPVFAATDSLTDVRPTAILFMLHVSSNKITALQNRGMEREANDVKTADYEINSSIVNDFGRNFKYCAIYFFYDTLLPFVQKKEWDKVNFFDYEHFKTNKKIEVSGIDNYLIAEVNYPPMTNYPTVDDKGTVHQPEYTVEYANARDYGIICYDENFQLLRNKLQFTNISMHRAGNIFKPESIRYRFIGALQFQNRLLKFYGKSAK